MSGSGGCCDDEEFFDCIQEAADCIRECVGSTFNNYSTNVVVVRWSGKTVGSGNVSVKSSVELSPEPKYDDNSLESISLNVEDGGRVEDGIVKLDVSNSISEDVLIPTVDKNEEFYWEMVHKKTGKRRRLFPVSSCLPSNNKTSRPINAEIRQAPRTKEGKPAESINTFIPMA